MKKIYGHLHFTKVCGQLSTVSPHDILGVWSKVTHIILHDRKVKKNHVPNKTI